MSVRVNNLGAERLTEGRVINMPSLNVSVSELAAAVGNRSDRKIGALSWKVEPAIARIFEGRPQAIDNRWALENGLEADADANAIIDHFVDDYCD